MGAEAIETAIFLCQHPGARSGGRVSAVTGGHNGRGTKPAADSTSKKDSADSTSKKDK